MAVLSGVRKVSNKVILVGPRSNAGVSTGLSIAFDMVPSALRKFGIPFSVVDTSNSEINRTVGSFDFVRIFSLFKSYVKFLTKIRGSSSVYITLSSSTWGFLKDSIFIWMALLFGLNVKIHLHGGGFYDFFQNQTGLYKAFVKMTLAKVSTYIVLGNKLRKQFDFIDLDNCKTKVVHNGLPPMLDPRFVQPKKVGTGGVVNFVYLSNMIESKGYLDLLEACRLMISQGYTNFTCKFYGTFIRVGKSDKMSLRSSDPKNEFCSLIGKYGLKDKVFYGGHISGLNKEVVLRDSHVFVLPSYYPWEGQPISIIEALAFGMPIVSTSHRGIPDLVIDGLNGLLVPPKSPEQVFLAMRFFVENPEKIKEMGLESIGHYKRNFTYDKHCTNIVNAIKDSNICPY